MMLARSSLNHTQSLRSSLQVAAQSRNGRLQSRLGSVNQYHVSAFSRRFANGQQYAKQQQFLFVRWSLSTNQTQAQVRWRIQQFSSQQKMTPVTPATKKPSLFSRYKRLAQAVRFARIAGVVVSVYALGYQQGIINCVRTPRLMEDELLQTILADVGVKNKEQVHIFTSEDKPNAVFAMATPSGRIQAQTVRIGNDIIRVASLHVRQELVKAIKAVQEKLPADLSPEVSRKICHEDDQVKIWEAALYRIEGENLHLPWKYVIVDSPLPNAFVSEILPQRFFITTSMFNHFVTNEDELAVILGHEISHLILGHVSQRNSMETTLRTIEVLLLSVDPTEGLLSLGVIAGLAWLRGILMASFSREHESEADELGLTLAAMACYDTKKGAHVMKKMHDHQVGLAGEPSKNSHLLHLLDTHPPSMDRYEKILKQSETENAGKYSHDHCASVQRRMMQAVWGSGPSS